MLQQIRQWMTNARIRRGTAPSVDAENFAYAFPRFYFEESKLHETYAQRFDLPGQIAAGEKSLNVLSVQQEDRSELNVCELLVVAKAGFLSGEPRFYRAAYQYVTQWMEKNPPYHSEQWRKPDQAALRLMGLVWSFSLLRQFADFDATAQSRVQEWIYRHAQYLHAWQKNLHDDIESIVCASALTVAGIQFPLFDHSEEWENDAWKVLLNRVETGLPQMAQMRKWARMICVLEFATLAYAVAKMKRLALPVTFIANVEKALQIIVNNRKEAELELAHSTLPHLKLNGQNDQLRALANSVGLMRQNRELLEYGQTLDEWTFWAAGERATQAFEA